MEFSAEELKATAKSFWNESKNVTPIKATAARRWFAYSFKGHEKFESLVEQAKLSKLVLEPDVSRFIDWANKHNKPINEKDAMSVIARTLWLTPTPGLYRQLTASSREDLFSRLLEGGDTFKIKNEDIEFRRHCWDHGYSPDLDGVHRYIPLFPVTNDLISYLSLDDPALSEDILGQLNWIIQVACREYFRSLEQAVEGGFYFKPYNHPNFEHYFSEFIYACLGKPFNETNREAQDILKSIYPMFYVRTIGIVPNTRMWQSTNNKEG